MLGIFGDVLITLRSGVNGFGDENKLPLKVTSHAQIPFVEVDFWYGISLLNSAQKINFILISFAYNFW